MRIPRSILLEKEDLPIAGPSLATPKVLGVLPSTPSVTSEVAPSIPLRPTSVLPPIEENSLLTNTTLAATKMLSIESRANIFKSATFSANDEAAIDINTFLGRVQKSKKASKESKTSLVIAHKKLEEQGSQIDQLKSLERDLEDKLKLLSSSREIELDRIFDVVDSTKSKKEKVEKEVVELKLELEELKPTIKAKDYIIKDLKTECVVNYAKDYEEFRDQAKENFDDFEFDFFVPLLSDENVEKVGEGQAEGDLEKRTSDIELHVIDLDSSTAPPMPEGTEQQTRGADLVS
ncbi:unnamed protein product [Ilex paraguariensis]|uniref:Uncharacterized protein n=1 Tax=Ilex paraguariensis TaxID=185542 RepID=A0ABC8UDN4_9AQUA